MGKEGKSIGDKPGDSRQVKSNIDKSDNQIFAREYNGELMGLNVVQRPVWFDSLLNSVKKQCRFLQPIAKF